MRSDEGGGYAVGVPRPRKNGEAEESVLLAQPTYYPDLASALKGVQKRIIHDSDATSLKEVLDVIHAFHDEVRAALADPPPSHAAGC